MPALVKNLSSLKKPSNVQVPNARGSVNALQARLP